MRPVKSKTCNPGKRHDEIARPQSGVVLDAGGILIRDSVAARRWLVNVIAARAVELHRKRRKRTGIETPNPSEDHDDRGHARADAQREERSR